MDNIKDLEERIVELRSALQSVDTASADPADITAQAEELRSLRSRCDAMKAREDALAASEEKIVEETRSASRGIVARPAAAPVPARDRIGPDVDLRGMTPDEFVASYEALAPMFRRSNPVTSIETRAASTFPIGPNKDIIDHPTHMETTATRGQELVTASLYGAVLNMFRRESVAMQLASIFTTDAQSLLLPIFDDVDAAAVVDEACEIPPIGAKFSRKSLILKKVAARISASSELLSDSAGSHGAPAGGFASLVPWLFGTSFAKLIDPAYFQGNAQLGSIGIVPAVTAYNSASNVVTTAAANATMQEIAQVQNVVDPVAPNRGWVVSDKFVAQLNVLNASAIGQSVAAGAPATIFGRPYVVSPNLGAKVLAIYGDIGNATSIITSGSMVIDQSAERQWEYDAILFRARMRLAMDCHTPRFLGVLKTA